MADTGLQQALIESLERQGFQVRLEDTGRLGCERYSCRLVRGNFGTGWFAATGLAVVQKAVEPVKAERFSL